VAVENFVDADCAQSSPTFGVWSSCERLEPSGSRQSAPTRSSLKRRPVARPAAALAIPLAVYHNRRNYSKTKAPAYPPSGCICGRISGSR